ncbi:hypothetical protein MMC17_002908 [Xylographa soralifera]|nr:hypothetical protein [Xylographa soralifera]
MPTTNYPAGENGSFGRSGSGDWDLCLGDLSLPLPLQEDFALEIGPLGVPDAGTPAEVELLTPAEYIADVDMPVELYAPLKQGLDDDEQLWWQPPAVEWDAGTGSILFDANATMIGFESLGCSHEWEQGLYADGGSESI